MKVKVVKTTEYTVEDFNSLVINDPGRFKFQGDVIKIEYVIREVGGDPLDRFPGRNQVTHVKIIEETEE